MNINENTKVLSDDYIMSELKKIKKIHTISITIGYVFYIVFIFMGYVIISNFIPDDEAKKYAFIVLEAIALIFGMIMIIESIKLILYYKRMTSKKWKISILELIEKKKTYNHNNDSIINNYSYYFYFFDNQHRVEVSESLYESTEIGEKFYVVIYKRKLMNMCYALSEYKYYGERLELDINLEDKNETRRI